jgi:putative ATPase
MMKKNREAGELFHTTTPTAVSEPLAQRLRPQSLNEIAGQENLLGPEGLLSRALSQKNMPSAIFWGPPGTGKTTTAQLLAQEVGMEFVALSAVLTGVKELRGALARAAHQRQAGHATLLFIDEIHRYNKAQQDALLHAVEDGTITFVGATTENPSFEVIGPLLSRCVVMRFEPPLRRKPWALFWIAPWKTTPSCGRCTWLWKPVPANGSSAMLPVTPAAC